MTSHVAADIHRQLRFQLFRGLARSSTTIHVLDQRIPAAL
jgi:hypothetical protein